jgi:hypothetical protein
LELQTSVDELLGGVSEDIGEQPTVVDYVQVDPVPLGIDPHLQVRMHLLQLLHPICDLFFYMRGKFTLGDHLEGVEVFFDSLVEGLGVDHDVGILRVFEGDNLELEGFPFEADGLEYFFILLFSIGVLTYLDDLFLIELNIVFLQLFDGELMLLQLQSRGFHQVKYLVPMTVLQRVSGQVLHKLQSQRGFLNLFPYLPHHGLALSQDNLMLREFMVEVLLDLVDSLEDKRGVKFEEGGELILELMFPPIVQYLPQSGGVPVDLIDLRELFVTLEVYLLHFLPFLSALFIDNVHEFLVQYYLGPQLMDL